MPRVPEDPDLDYVLNNSELAAILREDAVRQFAVENIDFLQAVNELEKLVEIGAPDEEVRAKAKEINDNFVKTSAASQANLDGDVREPLEAALSKADTMQSSELVAALQPAKSAIRSLVTYDTLPKMKNDCAAYKERMADIKALENRVDDLVARKEKLASSKLEQFKAFFQGGTKKVQEKLDAKIQTAKDGIIQMTDPNRLSEKRAAEIGQSASSRKGVKKNDPQQPKHTNRQSMEGKLGTGNTKGSKYHVG